MKPFIIARVAAGNHVCAQTLSHLTVELVVSVKMDSAGKVTSVYLVNAKDHHSHKKD